MTSESIERGKFVNRFLQAMAVIILALAGTVAVAADIVDGVAAIVNERVITYSEVKDYVQPLVAQLRRNYSGDDLVQKVRNTQMDALNRLIERALIIDEFKEKGYHIPDKVVDEQINDFIGNDFGGDRKAFVRTLQAQNMTLTQFRERERERVIVQAMLNQKSQREIVVSPYKIEKYYQEHADSFKVDEQIKLRMIFVKKTSLPPAPAARDTGLTNEPQPDTAEPAATPAPVATNDSETAAVPTNETPVTATNEMPVAETATNVPASPSADPHRALAEEILGKLDEGESFESLAKVYSEAKEANVGGDWGWIGRDVLRKELNEIAFSLKPGEHSRVIETAEGYYIVAVEDVKPAHVRPLAEVRDEVEKTLLQQQRTKMQEQWVQQLRAKAYIRLF